MGCSYLFKSTFVLAVSSVLALNVLGAPSLANETNAVLRQGLPGRRISGGSRSPDTACVSTRDEPVIALMPKNNIGSTLSAHPSFWFSLPAVNQNRTLEFGLFDQSGELVYQKSLSVPNEVGVTQLSLPETATPLQVNDDYRWYLSVVCNPESRSEDLVVTGWVRRVEADSTLRSQLSLSTPQEQLALYKTSELWYDALTTLSEMRRQNPDAPELEEQWNDLMQAIDLPQLFAAPFGSAIELSDT
ncbi:MAG: DUF928 domain-containing protein [Cyanobacteria bacterium P01_D01_bin.36]